MPRQGGGRHAPRRRAGPRFGIGVGVGGGRHQQRLRRAGQGHRRGGALAQLDRHAPHGRGSDRRIERVGDRGGPRAGRGLAGRAAQQQRRPELGRDEREVFGRILGHRCREETQREPRARAALVAEGGIAARSAAADADDDRKVRRDLAGRRSRSDHGQRRRCRGEHERRLAADRDGIRASLRSEAATLERDPGPDHAPLRRRLEHERQPAQDEREGARRLAARLHGHGRSRAFRKRDLRHDDLEPARYLLDRGGRQAGEADRDALCREAFTVDQHALAGQADVGVDSTRGGDGDDLDAHRRRTAPLRLDRDGELRLGILRDQDLELARARGAHLARQRAEQHGVAGRILREVLPGERHRLSGVDPRGRDRDELGRHLARAQHPDETGHEHERERTADDRQ